MSVLRENLGGTTIVLVGFVAAGLLMFGGVPTHEGTSSLAELTGHLLLLVTTTGSLAMTLRSPGRSRELRIDESVHRSELWKIGTVEVGIAGLIAWLVTASTPGGAVPLPDAVLIGCFLLGGGFLVGAAIGPALTTGSPARSWRWLAATSYAVVSIGVSAVCGVVLVQHGLRSIQLFGIAAVLPQAALLLALGVGIALDSDRVPIETPEHETDAPASPVLDAD